MQNFILVFTLSILDYCMYLFCANLVQKPNIFSLSLNLVYRLLEYEEFDIGFPFFSFRPKVVFFLETCSKGSELFV